MNKNIFVLQLVSQKKINSVQKKGKLLIFFIVCLRCNHLYIKNIDFAIIAIRVNII